MISQKEIRIKSERKYKAFLSAKLSGIDFFPLVIPADKKLDSSFDKMRLEIEELISHSINYNKYSYSIDFEEKNTKRHGKQSIPNKILFEKEKDFIGYLKKERETQIITKTFTSLTKEFPELRDWAISNPLLLSKIGDEFDFFIRTLIFFKSNPKPNLYVRELPIEVDTKFIERNKGLLRPILEVIIDKYVNRLETNFEKRFNLKNSEPLVRFRRLDKTKDKNIFSCSDDLTIPISAFQSIQTECSTIIITENLMNFLTLPPKENTIAIWGKGLALNLLSEIKWLSSVNLKYWGDIDEHGFLILSQFRSFFPKTQSIMMDTLTLNEFENYVVEGKNASGIQYEHLRTDEIELLEMIKSKNIRLEQEKITHEYSKIRI
ncbi:DUF3322 and DUF2220 domain-containing protein [Prolixibacteraceae bacterium JC049]|nr:DUF3322 and DUF2220 domain-containing protein [Prolixibacteraceae bacterium JC049]